MGFSQRNFVQIVLSSGDIQKVLPYLNSLSIKSNIESHWLKLVDFHYEYLCCTWEVVEICISCN